MQNNQNFETSSVISNSDDVFKKAIILLSKKAYSKKMLLKKLYEKGCEKEACQIALNKLEELKLIDDFEYANMLYRHYKAKGFGEIRISKELEQKGIERETISNIMEENADDNSCEEVIKAFLLKKFKSMPPDKKEISSAISALMRKGFRLGQISPIVRGIIDKEYEGFSNFDD